MRHFPRLFLALLCLALACCGCHTPVAVARAVGVTFVEETPADLRPESPPETVPQTAEVALLHKIDHHRDVVDWLLFHPSDHDVGNWQPTEIQFQDMQFTAADGTQLHGWYCPAANPRAHVLFLHGNAGNVATWASYARLLQSKLGVSAFLVDFRGYGRSEGKPTVTGVLADARAARAEFARCAGVRETDVVLMGRSLGGALAVQLAAEHPARGLIVESSFSSLKDIARHHFPKLAWMVPEESLHSAKAIKNHRGPLLISHGNGDTTIPFAQGEQLFAAGNEPKTFHLVPGGTHNDPPSVDYVLALNRFLADLPPVVR